MEVKKNNKYNLEKKRMVFLQLGLVISLSIVLLAFEYKVPVNDAEVILCEYQPEEDVLIPNTFHEQEKIVPPSLPKIMYMDLIEISEDPDDIDYLPEDSFGDPNETVALQPIGEVEEIDDEELPFVVVEQMPIFNPKKNKSYKAGLQDLFKTMQRNVKYPVIAQESAIEGKVYVRFVVTKKGKIGKVEVVRSVDPILDQEVIRMVRNLPSFSPGKQRAKAVPVWFSGFVNFKLQ